MKKISFKEIQEKQKELDAFILQKISSVENEKLFLDRIIALLVEFGEFLNERKDFKYWSITKNVNKDAQLEEYIDCLHFILSIANIINYDVEIEYSESDKTLKELYLDLFNFSVKLNTKDVEERKKNLALLVVAYMQVAEKVGFTEKEIFSMYKTKNEINYKRAKSKY
ncbi:MAG: dUTP diphosphatase [Mycoplasma sp.]|nr:dUTP diphosphatase [Mycoplasma sp.]